MPVPQELYDETDLSVREAQLLVHIKAQRDAWKQACLRIHSLLRQSTEADDIKRILPYQDWLESLRLLKEAEELEEILPTPEP